MSLIAIVRVPVVACLGIGMAASASRRFIMRRQRKAGRPVFYITRACAAAAVGVALAAAAVTAASASAAAPRAPQTMQVADGGASVAATSPGTQLWVARYDNPGYDGTALSVAASPNGKAVFVTGYVTVGALQDSATVAYNAATGAQLWAVRYADPGHSIDRGYSVAVSPNGSTVFVTGTSLNSPGAYYDTIAYSAATGAQLWLERYSAVDTYDAPAVAVSPNGSTVLVTGTATGGEGYATLAYNAATGHQQWVKLYAGPAGAGFGHSLAVSPDGTKVLVTGVSLGTNDGYDYATVAYNTTTGTQLWAARYNGATEGRFGANSVAVSPNGKTVFVTGSSYAGTTTGYDYATAAYNATTGAQLWAKRYNGPGNGDDSASSVAVSPGGGTVYVTGYAYMSSVPATDDYTTIAYNAATGAQLWRASYNGPGDVNEARALAVSPDGTTVYVTGYSYGCICGGDDYATVAYNAATGAQLWVQRYDGTGLGSQAFAMTVSPNTGTVFVTGYTAVGGSFDYATVAYQG